MIRMFLTMLGAFFASMLAIAPASAASPAMHPTPVDLLYAAVQPSNAPAVATNRSGSGYAFGAGTSATRDANIRAISTISTSRAESRTVRGSCGARASTARPRLSSRDDSSGRTPITIGDASATACATTSTNVGGSHAFDDGSGGAVA